MKKIILFALLLSVFTVCFSQIKKIDTSSINKTPVPVKAVRTIANMPSATPVTTNQASGTVQQKPTGNSDQQSQAIDNSQYIITGARVIINTGSDAKEYPSKVKVYLFAPPTTTYTYACTLTQQNITNAMVVNSSTEIGLTPLYQQKVPWPVYYAGGYNGTNKPSSPFTSGSHNWMLDDLLQQGFRLLIGYHPNLALDAWEIKQVTVKLKIEKADGTPHPTLNNKTIVFNISTPMLGVPTGMTLVCEADKNFEPTTNYLTKDIFID